MKNIDIIFINSKSFIYNEDYGILQQSWWSYQYIYRNNHDVYLFIDNYQIHEHMFVGKIFFSIPLESEPKIFQTSNIVSKLAHWVIFGNKTNSLIKSVDFSKNILNVISVMTSKENDKESNCMIEMQKKMQTSLFENAGIKNTNYIFIHIKEKKNHFGIWGQESYRLATFLKTKTVQMYLRLGIDIILSDVDIYYNQKLPINDYIDIFNNHKNVSLIISQDTYACLHKFAINTGFYIIKSNNWSIDFLSKVLHRSQKSKYTEQGIWNFILNERYIDIIKGKCKNMKLFNYFNSSFPIVLLSQKNYTNGYWMKKVNYNESFLIHFNWIKGNCLKFKTMSEVINFH